LGLSDSLCSQIKTEFNAIKIIIPKVSELILKSIKFSNNVCNYVGPVTYTYPSNDNNNDVQCKSCLVNLGINCSGKIKCNFDYNSDYKKDDPIPVNCNAVNTSKDHYACPTAANCLYFDSKYDSLNSSFLRNEPTAPIKIENNVKEE